ncbi:unnamed protein product [Cuscuta campestris]|uniref:F-box domain-containing protein n=1 Tax=Cuscuta campestris TaxID=132261 RepID=A0A484N6M2_9ASTE|nr:unnamed protein product [Cuscuta campestris]
MQRGEEIKKKEARRDEEGDDRISDLPLQLRAAIVCLLPVEEAVRTTVLSKSWTHVWTHFNHLALNMDPDKLCRRRLNGRDTQPFKSLLDSLARLNVGIRSLTLSRARGTLIQQLVDADDEHYYSSDHQWSLFSKFLEVLDLWNAQLMAPIIASERPLPFQRCTNLRTLKLSKVSLQVHRLEAEIFPNCNLLESMSLHCCGLLGLRSLRREVFSISAPINLKSLGLHGVRLKGADFLSIKAPGLRNLALNNTYFYYYTKVIDDVPEFSFALDAPELVALQVHGIKFDAPPYPQYDGPSKFYYLTCTHILRLFFLSSSPQVQQSTQFRSLRSLSSDLDLNDAGDRALLLRILKLSPSLERLYISIPHHKKSRTEVPKSSFARVNLNMAITHRKTLRILEITSFHA